MHYGTGLTQCRFWVWVLAKFCGCLVDSSGMSAPAPSFGPPSPSSVPSAPAPSSVLSAPAPSSAPSAPAPSPSSGPSTPEPAPAPAPAPSSEPSAPVSDPTETQPPILPLPTQTGNHSKLQKWAKRMLLDERRRALRLRVKPCRLPHMAFLGNPGTESKPWQRDVKWPSNGLVGLEFGTNHVN
ncbi:hypothetical protein HanPI659440_Chr17g0695721 [Helianthus annuus]|nr:hypothetical protein HanPI659440_Chr17g0695721 [Helianthus annuus]